MRARVLVGLLIMAWAGLAHGDVTAAQLTGKWKGTLIKGTDESASQKEALLTFTADGHLTMIGVSTKGNEMTYTIEEGVIVLRNAGNGLVQFRLVGVELTDGSLKAELKVDGAPSMMTKRRLVLKKQ